jgi:Ras-related protein Rab-23
MYEPVAPFVQMCGCFILNYPGHKLSLLQFQVVIVGDGGVGKSSLIRRYCQGVFTSAYKKTIGVDFLERVVNIDNGEQVRLMIWDTAGQEEFDAITRAYYRLEMI